MAEITSRVHEWLNDLISRHPNNAAADAIAATARSSQKFFIGECSDFISGTSAVKNSEAFRLPFPKTIIEARTCESELTWQIIVAEELCDTRWRVFVAQRTDEARWLCTAPFHVDRDGPSMCIAGANEQNMILYEWGFSLLMRACLAMQCENVRAVRPAAYRPATTKPKGGRYPLFSHKVLVVDMSGKGSVGWDRAGTHASPRLHLRRGHARRLPSGATVWVQPCVVGDKSKGMVTKDYRVTA